MKRLLCGIMILAVLLSMFEFSAMAAPGETYLPGRLTEVQAEAFCGDRGMTTLVIPKAVKKIGSRAFADCTGLTDVYVGNNPTMEFATDAFEGCSGVLFHVYPESSAELFALSHGFRREYLEPGSAAWERTMSMIGDAGFSDSYFNSPQWTTKRLIVRRTVDYLPDISAFNPISIVEKGYYHIFIIQFDTPENTRDCYSVLLSDDKTVYVEEDSWHEMDIVQSAGTVDSGVWKTPDGTASTDDPIGFDVYAPFVKQNSSGVVKIAIIDSGVKNHAHYDSILVDGKNMLEDIDGQSWNHDAANHGSIIASIIKDCVGSNNVRLIPIRVAGTQSQFDDELLASGIDYAVAKGASIINLSMSFPPSAVVKDAINHAASSGVTIVVAAGNDDRNVANVFPANMSNVVTVSGIEPGYVKEEKSNWGAVDYCAPARYLCTTAYASNPRFTSFAAPMIASAFALLELDPLHSVADMNASCILTEDPSLFGRGLPQLAKLAKIDATGIQIDAQSVPETLAAGKSYNVSWTITPANATNKTVTLSSSNEAVAKVTAGEDGQMVITAVAPGTATITVTANSGSNVSATMTVTVVRPVAGITIAGAPSKMVIGDKVTLAANISPANATTKTLAWKSTNPSVATVNQDGVVTAVGEGSATIYALANDGYGAESQKVTINVVAVPDAQSVVLTEAGGLDVSSGSVKLVPGKTIQLQAKVLPADAVQTVAYSCKAYPEGCVTVTADGQVRAVSSGVAFVTVTTANGVSKDLSVEVVVLPASVTVNGAAKVNVGEQITLAASVAPDNAYDHSVTWSSDNTAVATVSANGTVTGTGAGTAIIKAAANGNAAAYANWKITVIQLPTSVKVTGPETMNVGTTAALTATVLPATAADKSVIWSSDNPAAVTVNSSGVVSAVGKGTANIIASAKAAGGVSGSWKITTIQLADGITVTGSTALKVGDTTPMTAKVSPSNADNTRVTWSSSNTAVATVSSSGVVTAVGAGEAKIIATAADGSKVTGSINIVVTPATFTVTFNANGGYCATTSMTAERDKPLGTLPVPVQDHHEFLGWYLDGVDNYLVDAATYFLKTDPITLNARWKKKAESSWVTPDQVPEGAEVVQHAYSYRELTESTSDTMDGWTANGSYWKQTGTAAAHYATFPSGYDKTDKYYTGFMKAPYTESETAYTKRTVSNTWAGYVYWHWAYNVKYASGTTRRISNKKGSFTANGGTGDGAYYFGYFYAMASKTDCKKLDNGYCNNQYQYGYNCKTLVDQFATSADKTNSKSGLATDRFFRFDYYTSTYTDYQKIFSFYRDVSMSSTYPTGSFTNLVEYVTYIPR